MVLQFDLAHDKYQNYSIWPVKSNVAYLMYIFRKNLDTMVLAIRSILSGYPQMSTLVIITQLSKY